MYAKADYVYVLSVYAKLSSQLSLLLADTLSVRINYSLLRVRRFD